MSCCYDIVIEKYSTFVLSLLVYADNSVTLKDFTGHTAELNIGKKLASGEIDQDNIIKTLTTENGGIILGGTFGTIDIKMTKEQTAELLAIDSFYTLKIFDALGADKTLFHGSVKIKDGVSNGNA